MTTQVRPSQPSDEAFLFVVYSSTRPEEMHLLDWSADQKESFLRIQFHMHYEYYLSQFPISETHIAEENEEPIGQMIMNRADREIPLMDIARLSEQRSAGIGAGLVRSPLMQDSFHPNYERRW